MNNDLGAALVGATLDETTASMRYGIVTLISPLMVTVGASTVSQPCSAIASYQPFVGDYVLVLVQGADRIVVGRASSGAGGSAFNWVHNSQFSIDQRNNSFVTGTAYNYPADRWCFVRGGFAAGVRASRIWGFPGINNVPGAHSALRISRDSGNASTTAMYLEQGYERQDVYPLAGQVCTLSWSFIKYSNWLTGVHAQVWTGTGVDRSVLRGTATSPALAGTFNFVNTNNGRASVTFTVPSNATELGVRFELNPNAVASTGSDILDIGQIKLEIGSSPTPWYPVPVEVELTNALRFFDLGQYRKMVGVCSGAANSAIARMGAPLKVPMRAAPTLTLVNGPINTFDGVNVGTGNAITASYSTTDLIEFDATQTIVASGVGAGSPRTVTTYVAGAWRVEAFAEII